MRASISSLRCQLDHSDWNSSGNAVSLRASRSMIQWYDSDARVVRFLSRLQNHRLEARKLTAYRLESNHWVELGIWSDEIEGAHRTVRRRPPQRGPLVALAIGAPCYANGHAAPTQCTDLADLEALPSNVGVRLSRASFYTQPHPSAQHQQLTRVVT